MISLFDLYKIGIGPSSSHTMGPMIAAKRFRDCLEASSLDMAAIEVVLYGSLAWTAKGHGSERAICLGMLGEEPHIVDPDRVPHLVGRLEHEKQIRLSGGRAVGFDPAKAIHLEKTELLPRHSNAMRFRSLTGDGSLVKEETYYSVGGGFVLAEDEHAATAPCSSVTYSFRSASELLRMCENSGLTIAGVQMANERLSRSNVEVSTGADSIKQAMFDCIDRGMSLDGELPGGLKVRRRAKRIREKLLAPAPANAVLPHEELDWVSVYALAVNEENAAGGRIVTAPTNGAAGIVPAVLRYFTDLCPDRAESGARDFLLTSAAIGGLIKSNASISGAEVGCQGEVGSASAMAAAGLAAVLGGTPAQVENAAEIALEHHLGMTCDPVGGLVQVPCIERNAIGAQKAIAAASLALRGEGEHRVSLDEAVETMRQTGIDMQDKYKETSRGGLALNVAEC